MPDVVRERRGLPPLENGDLLTRAEFHRRYVAMPGVNKAQLIEGVVYMPSPVRAIHGSAHVDLAGVLMVYRAYTPGVMAIGEPRLAFAGLQTRASQVSVQPSELSALPRRPLSVRSPRSLRFLWPNGRCTRPCSTRNSTISTSRSQRRRNSASTPLNTSISSSRTRPRMPRTWPISASEPAMQASGSC